MHQFRDSRSFEYWTHKLQFAIDFDKSGKKQALFPFSLQNHVRFTNVQWRNHLICSTEYSVICCSFIHAFSIASSAVSLYEHSLNMLFRLVFFRFTFWCVFKSQQTILKNTILTAKQEFIEIFLEKIDSSTMPACIFPFCLLCAVCTVHAFHLFLFINSSSIFLVENTSFNMCIASYFMAFVKYIQTKMLSIMLRIS